MAILKATLFSMNHLSVLTRIAKDEKGQDLVEYAAVIVLVVLALTGGMSSLASGINNAMVNVGTYINATIG